MADGALVGEQFDDENPHPSGGVVVAVVTDAVYESELDGVCEVGVTFVELALAPPVEHELFDVDEFVVLSSSLSTPV